MSGDRYDVAVVGAGIVGLGVALAAVRRGMRVVVLERGSEATGASIRNFGHLCVTPQAGVAREYAHAAREIWLGLARDAGVWLRERGTLVVARADDELALLEEFAAMRAVAGAPSEVKLLDAREIARRAPVAPRVAVGGAHLPLDLQANPRQALTAVTAHVQRLGVELRFRTAVGAVEPGLVRTSRGDVHADRIVVAVNADIDLLFPEVAERERIERCGLDMLRVDAGLRAPLESPLLTGWSLVRYGGFSETSAAPAVRERLRAERPELAALDLNQMYTQLPDGTLIVGDTHVRGTTIAPFQPEAAADLMLAETAALFGLDRARIRVVERWQGVYASGPGDYLDLEVAPGVHLAAATTGIGMTTGFGLAEAVVARFTARPAAPADHSSDTTDHEAGIPA